MGTDTDRRNKIDAIDAKIDALNHRLKLIPAEIEHMENERRQLRARIMETTKKMQAEGRIQESSAFVGRAQTELRGISRNIDEKLKEQTKILAEIKELENERIKTLSQA